MICKCKLPIIRGYEPDCYCLNCGLKLKTKTMGKKIKSIKLKKEKLDSFSALELIKIHKEIFDIEYEPEPERKKICVEIEYDVEKGDEYKMDSSGIQTALTRMDNCYVKELNIKVTEIKPSEISKEDAEWFYKKNYCSFKSAWAEFQEKKEAENG